MKSLVSTIAVAWTYTALVVVPFALAAYVLFPLFTSQGDRGLAAAAGVIVAVTGFAIYHSVRLFTTWLESRDKHPGTDEDVQGIYKRAAG